MYAVIECGGKQYRVQEGDRLKVEKIKAAIGETVTIDKVLLLGGEKTVVGTPFVEGAAVNCKVLNQDKDAKVLVFHYKAKKNIRKRYGHRQPFTDLLVESILESGFSGAPKAAKTEKTVQPEAAVKADTKDHPVKAEAEKAPVKKAATAKTEKDNPETVKKTASKTTKASSAKTMTAKAETAAVAEPKPEKKPAARAKKAETATETEAASKKATRKPASKPASEK